MAYFTILFFLVNTNMLNRNCTQELCGLKNNQGTLNDKLYSFLWVAS